MYFSTNLTLGTRTKDLHSMGRSRKPVVVPIECSQPKTMATPTAPKLKVPDPPLNRSMYIARQSTSGAECQRDRAIKHVTSASRLSSLSGTVASSDGWAALRCAKRRTTAVSGIDVNGRKLNAARHQLVILASDRKSNSSPRWWRRLD